MSQNKGKGKAGGAGKGKASAKAGAEEKREDALQAVVSIQTDGVASSATRAQLIHSVSLIDPHRHLPRPLPTLHLGEAKSASTLPP